MRAAEADDVGAARFHGRQVPFQERRRGAGADLARFDQVLQAVATDVHDLLVGRELTDQAGQVVAG